MTRSTIVQMQIVFLSRIASRARAKKKVKQLCGDWVDNDGDGVKDCEDMDCNAPGITTCYGSWDLRKAKIAEINPETTKSTSLALPELKEGMGIEDLIGSGKDKDGERNDVLCSDGFDNDGDGMVDCADYGCRFDPDVTICQGVPTFAFRSWVIFHRSTFSVVKLTPRALQ